MAKPNPVNLGELGLDSTFLQRELDRAKSALFIGSNAAFLGSLMCALNFYWSTDIPTAATNGVDLIWNPTWFLTLKPNTRKTVLVHELWHVARLHMARQGTRNHKVFNYACDIRINNDLEMDGYSFEGVEDCWKNPDFPYGMAEEDIYDVLIQTHQEPEGGSWDTEGGDGDAGDMMPLDELSKEDFVRAINNVVRACHQAKLSGGAGTIPGGIEELINKFLAPVIPWETVLNRFMSDLIQEEYSWRKPNRRFPDMFLPSHVEDEGALAHLIYYEDVSGSISPEDALRFNSEVKYVKDKFNPKKMTLVQFDTQITQERVFHENDRFNEIEIVGRGGTSLVPVREHILEHRPTAAIIFSDLDCPMMQPLDFEVPVIWVAIKNRDAAVPFGEIIHIR